MNTPIYYHSATYAREHGELDQYRNTLKACRICARDIESIISARFDGMHLDKVAVHEVLCIHDEKIVAIVLSATLIDKSYDGRFNPFCTRWAESIKQLDAPSDSFIVTTHPTILNGFIAMFIKIAY